MKYTDIDWASIARDRGCWIHTAIKWLSNPMDDVERMALRNCLEKAMSKTEAMEQIEDKVDVATIKL